LWTKFRGHGVQVVAVHISETEAQAKTWMQGLGVTFPAIQDTAGFTIAHSYIQGEVSVPHPYIIGRDMIIRKDWVADEGNLLDVIYMRSPVDVVMVMDVSDSMTYPSPAAPVGDSKLDMMKQTMTMITDFLRDHGQPDDCMGLVWFTDDVSAYHNLTNQYLVSVHTYHTDLRTQIQSKTTGTCTAMGAGLQKSFQMLAGSAHGKYVVLCTDGMQNVQPMVSKVGNHYEIIDSPGMYECGGHSSIVAQPGVDIASYGTTVHTIGVGITANYGTFLQEIADATGGYYRGTNDPDIDLDLIYFVDLCNCLAGGSPSVVLHAPSILGADQCTAEEHFSINQTVRKMTVTLSWKKSLGGSLTFWLYSPDGTLLDLHREMRFSETYAMATIFLPPSKSGKEIQHVGKWRLVIAGQYPGKRAEYHAMVIAEDYNIKYRLDYPRKIYSVGDLLPVRIQLKDLKRLITRFNRVLINTACLPVPLQDMLAQYKYHDLARKGTKPKRKSEYSKNPFMLKLETMEVDQRFKKMIKPERKQLSFSKEKLKSYLKTEEIHIPIRLTQPGLHTFKVEIQADAPKGGPIQRVDLISVFVVPGHADPKHTQAITKEIAAGKMRGVSVQAIPRNSRGQLFGPGYAKEFKATAGKKAIRMDVQDLLNGSYEMSILLPEGEWAGMEERGEKPKLTFQGKVILG